MNTVSKEPILINGLSVSGAVVATLAVAERLGANILEGDAAVATAFISVVVIPIGTWVLSRRKTVTVPKANSAIAKAEQGQKVEPFQVGQ
jgi:hypothetical protein